MKRRTKKTLWLSGLSLLLIFSLVGVAAFTYPDNMKSEEQLATEEEIAECIQNSEALYAEMDVIPLTLLENKEGAKSAYLSAAEKEELLKEKDALYDCYSDDMANSIRDKADDILSYCQSCLNETIEAPLCIGVKSGVSDMEFSNYEIEGNTAWVQGSVVAWTLWIEQQEPKGDYYVTMTVNRDTKKYQLSKESGSWKIEEITDDQKEFPPEDFSPEKAHCETVEEAIEAAKQIDIDKELSVINRM